MAKKKYRVALESLAKFLGYTPKHIEIAKVLVEAGLMKDIKKGANTLGNRYHYDGFLNCDEVLALRKHYYAEEEDYDIKESLKDVCPIPYWEGCEDCIQNLKSPLILRPKIADGEIIDKKLLRKRENFRQVVMPDRRMEGEPYRYKQGDLLCIDISDTNYANGGKFFYISKGKNSTAEKYIAAVAELGINFDGNTTFKFSNPTDPTRPIKVFTQAELEERQFRVIGRVIYDWFKTE